MANELSIKLRNRSAKQPIKRLPASVQLSPTTTVEELKSIIAKSVGLNDHNRVGLFDPKTSRTLKDRKALVSDLDAFTTSGEVQVRDLGYQISWTTVFIIEYLGPLLFHPAVLVLRPYLFPSGPVPELNRTQLLGFYMIMGHFVKRELETLFVHKFSANTMPWRNVFKNSFFYWALAGLLAALSMYGPYSMAARAHIPALDAIGVALYVFSESMNAAAHMYLSSLRTTGGTERQIPLRYGFGFVTCANYLWEILAWAGMILVTRDPGVTLFISIGIAQMAVWAKGKEKAYRTEFGDRYKKKRYVLLPGIF